MHKTLKLKTCMKPFYTVHSELFFTIGTIIIILKHLCCVEINIFIITIVE